MFKWLVRITGIKVKVWFTDALLFHGLDVEELDIEGSRGVFRALAEGCISARLGLWYDDVTVSWYDDDTCDFDKYQVSIYGEWWTFPLIMWVNRATVNQLRWLRNDLDAWVLWNEFLEQWCQ